jgi:hypothetical protein
MKVQFTKQFKIYDAGTTVEGFHPSIIADLEDAVKQGAAHVVQSIFDNKRTKVTRVSKTK